MEETMMICPKCGGNGLRWYGKCRECGGSGGVSSSNPGTDTPFVGEPADRRVNAAYAWYNHHYLWNEHGVSGDGGGDGSGSGDGGGGD
jgi:hypothetical protein